jgi:uncharacterized protein
MYYISNYIVYLIAMLACMIISGIASAKVKNAYAKYSRVPSRSGLTGYNVAVRLLRMNGINDISVDRVAGTLTDHYAPAQSVVNLSTSTYGDRSVASSAVAAHEIGHVMQKYEGWLPYRIRTALVPVVNIGTNLAMPLVLIGIILDTMVRTSSPDLGFHVAMFGVILYGAAFVFALVTLPVELDASRRAGKMLISAGVLTDAELPGAQEVLAAAAGTYLASLLTSLISFLRFLFYVLSIFGRSSDRRR